MTVSRKSSATSTAETIDVPSAGDAPAAGDLMVLCDRSSGFANPGTAVPSGWTALINLTDGSQNTQQLLYRESDGTEGGDTITGLGGSGNDIRKILTIFTSDAGIDSITADTSPNSALQNSAPPNQTIDTSGRTAPVIAMALYGSSGAIDPRGFSPAEDEELTAATNFFFKYKIYGTSPADIAVSMDDEGSQNGLFSGWFEVVETAGGGTTTLTADAGSFTLTGQVADLTRIKLIDAEAGSFTLTGQAAGLVVDGQINAETGAFTLSGQDAGFTLARHIDLGVGAFEVNGQVAELTVSQLLVADAGSFTLTGQDTGFSLGYLLAAEAGSFALNGQDAGLQASGSLAALSGSFVLTGNNATLINPQLQMSTIIFYME